MSTDNKDSKKVSEQLNTLLSRPQEKRGFYESNDVAVQEIQLAFSLTGLSRSDLFSPFFPLHSLIASRLVDFFISLPTVNDLVSAATWGRDNINPNLFNYAFSAACLGRTDTKDVLILNPAETFPDKYFPAELFQSIIQELTVVPAGSRIPVQVDVPKTATEKYNETRMEYFRHDLGLNICYYFWHLTHPNEAVKREIVDIDRRGELWYYFHQQIIARYNSERYCNGLLPVKPLSNLDLPIEEGYFPKLCTQHLEHSWASRVDRSYLQDLNRPFEGLMINKTRLKRWIDRACNAIELRTVYDVNGNKISLNNDKGVDIVGNLLQASILSPNRQFYGDICNMGHAFIAYCHDPQNLANQAYGVMGEPSTCARDILFYRWYAYLIQIVQLHKSQLPVYKKDQLGFDGIKLTSVTIKNSKGIANLLNTKWEETDFNLKNGLDFQPSDDIYARIKHLMYEDFQYELDIQNDNSSNSTGTVRLFLTNKCNTRDRVLTFEELRMRWIEMDRFQVDLTPGNNHIIRKSSESSVTIPYTNIFESEKVRQQIISGSDDQSSLCLTGWPSHLLVPKGTKEGAKFVLFAMVSNDGKVDDSPISNRFGAYDECRSGTSYCGLPNRLYPDSRPMGFPFDRPAPIEVISLSTFLSKNMKTIDFTIKFNSK